MISLEKMEKLQLEWLGRQATPMWGGHLKRGEELPIDSDMRRWSDSGLIEQVGIVGYRLTDAGRKYIKTKP